MNIPTRQWLAVIIIAAALAGITSCDSTNGPDQPAADPSSASGAASADPDAGPRRAGRTSALALGDLNKPKTAQELGAPFDPCGLQWTDFPAEVRPTDGTPHAPTLRAPQEGDGFDLRCLYDNSGKIRVDVNNPQSSGVEGGYFLVSVIWDHEAGLDPAKTQGATAKTFNGRPGLVARSPDDAKTGARLCLAAVRVGAGGAAGVSVTNSRFKQTDPCTVAETVVTAIAAKTQ
jgi:hypothetical protein